MGFIKAEVARENLFRLMPEFIFLPDPGLDRAARLEELLKEAGVDDRFNERRRQLTHEENPRNSFTKARRESRHHPGFRGQTFGVCSGLWPAAKPRKGVIWISWWS